MEESNKLEKNQNCCMVSVVCITYNQKKYIADAIESFLMQKTDFEFEILINDDASTDGTADIVREYAEKYPNLIVPVLQEENQFQKKVNIINDILTPMAKGEYIALCEGDDYWTDPYKLQKQYDAMKLHPQVDMCAHAAMCIDCRTNKEWLKISASEKETILSLEDVILGGGGYFASSSLFYRKSLDFNKYEFSRMMMFDFIRQICGAMNGGVLFLPECMSVYRILSDGSWSSNMSESVDKYVSHNKKTNDALKQLDIDTHGKYSEAISVRILKNEFEFHKYCADYRILFSKEFRPVLKTKPLAEKIKLAALALFPMITKLKGNR